MRISINNRSHFSIGSSLLTPEEIVTKAHEAGYQAVAITDDMNVNCLPEFFNAANKLGIKPIIGARLLIVDELFHDRDSRKKYKPYWLRLLVRNQAGFTALLKLLSRANDAEHFYNVARLLLSDVAEVMGAAGQDACLITLGDFYGAYQHGNAVEVVRKLSDVGLMVASEILPINTPHFVRLAHDGFQMQDELQVPVISGMPAFYSDPEHADALDVMKAIASNFKLSGRSTKHHHREFIVKTDQELRSQFDVFANALADRYGGDALHWSERLNAATEATEGLTDDFLYEWSKLPPSLPKMAEDEFEALKRACMEGWKTRFAKPVFGYRPTDLKPYAERLKHELGVLKKMKFEAYFLLVADIMQWAKANGVRCGAGRGSSGGSLVAYLLNIVDTDPVRFNLLFSRFINDQRQDLPDADLDFMSGRRAEVVEYIYRRFGADKTARISNFTTMAAAGTLNNVCRTLGFESHIAFSKYVPSEHGVSASLEETVRDAPELNKFAEDNPEIMSLAWPLEDKMRSYGLHAAGVIVADVPLVERSVLATRGDERYVNWDKSSCEDFGLVKIDVLGLATLDMIDVTLRQIKNNYGRNVDPIDFNLDDEKVLAEFAEGRSVGIFQMEAGVPRKMLMDLAEVTPLTFEDLIVVNALNRPGPLDAGLHTSYINRKNKKEVVSYPHDLAEKTLKNTFGVIVFQEQIQQLFIDLAGFSGPEADLARRAIGKKDLKKMASLKDQFINGCVANGMTDASAQALWGDVVGFASYAFNRSHSASYSILSYICQYLKLYYPSEFFAGLLSFVKDERRPAALKDMQRLGITLMPPDINQSGAVFEAINSTTVMTPFSAIKGISDSSAVHIMEAREKGRIESKEDFVAKVNRTKCNIKIQNLLDAVGAFASVEPETAASDHPDRRRDQVELLEGLIISGVQIDRDVVFDEFTLQQLTQLVADYRSCDRCELAGLCHPKPFVKAPPKMMLVFDAPNWKEEKADKMGTGNHMTALNFSLSDAGFTSEDIYITSVVKSPKPDKETPFSNKTLNECGHWLNKEIELLKPPLIIALGTQAARHFTTELKGGISAHTGKVIFDRERDLNVLIGLNIGTIYFHPEKQSDLNDIFKQARGLLGLESYC